MKTSHKFFQDHMRLFCLALCFLATLNAWAGEFEVIVAEDFLRQVRSGDIQGDLDIYHVEGRVINPALEKAIKILEQKGFKIHGTLVHQLPEISELHLEGALPYFVRPDTPDQRKTIMERFTVLRQRIAEVTRDLTFFRYCHHLFRPSRDQVMATVEALAIANPILYYALNQMEKAGNHQIHKIAPLVVLSAWIVTYIFNIEQIAGFKGQVSTIVQRPEAEPGQQIQVQSNSVWVFATSFVQEVILNSLLIISAFPQEAITSSIILNAITNAPLATFAKTPFEARISNLLNESDLARRQGDSERAEPLKRRAIRVERVSSNYLFPALKLLHLMAPALIPHAHSALQSLVAHASWIGLVATGLGGMAIKAYESRHRIAAWLRQESAPATCETALRLRPQS